jgi:hypothetical protein
VVSELLQGRVQVLRLVVGPAGQTVPGIVSAGGGGHGGGADSGGADSGGAETVPEMKLEFVRFLGGDASGESGTEEGQLTNPQGLAIRQVSEQIVEQMNR